MPTTDKPLNFWSQVDWITIALYIGLMAFGWISICGASYTYGENDIFALSTRSGMQIIWIGTSICLGFVILMMDTRFFDTFSYVIYGVLLLLLFATIFNPHDIKGSHSWLVIGPLRLQPAEFGKFATALALAKLMSSYGFNIGRWKHFAAACAVIFIPMLCIVGQRETGSALVYLTFFLVLYREGMPGSILFTGVAMVVYFVVGIKYESVLMLDTPTSVGRFVVLTLVQIFTACMVDVYTKQRRQTRLILGYGLGVTVLAMLFSVYVIPFDVTWIQLLSCAAIAVYLLLNGLRTRLPQYFLILGFAVGSVVFFYSADYVLNNVMEPHQRVRINVLLGLDEDLAGAGYNVHQSEIAIGSGGLKGTEVRARARHRLHLLHRGRRGGLCRFGWRAADVPGADIATDEACRTATVHLRQDIRLLCSLGVPFPCVHQCWNGAGPHPRYRHSATVFQLWRIVAMGIHHFAIYFSAY